MLLDDIRDPCSKRQFFELRILHSRRHRIRCWEESRQSSRSMKPVGNATPCEPNSTAVLHRRAQEESIAQVRHDVEEKSIAQIHRQVPVSVAQVYAFSRVGSVFRRLLIDYPSDEESEQEGKSCSRELRPHPQLSAAGPAPPAIELEGVRSTQSSQSSEYVPSPSESQENPARLSLPNQRRD
ncbi:hypothetical protein PF010_g29497 [Phytophthora fragariae]|uniref:Uncharacterized protein n=1 Tax=Phytophthora fragariae TaxID=53985 RepID=A0A6G0JNH6_9STRA|nr:hypothetical protein PF010_g29497 [Phytophthora fragariae]